VEAAKLLHDEFANESRWHLALAHRAQSMNQSPYGLFEFIRRHRPLFQCPDHAVSQLVLVERLPAAVALDQARHYQFRRLERGETLVAIEALAAPAHLPAITGEARIDHLGFFVTAKGTVHAIRLELRSIIHERHQRQEAEPR